MGQGPPRNRPAVERGEEGEREAQRRPQGLGPRNVGASMSTRCRRETREGAATPGRCLPPWGSASLPEALQLVG